LIVANIVRIANCPSFTAFVGTEDAFVSFRTVSYTKSVGNCRVSRINKVNVGIFSQVTIPTLVS